MTNIHSLLKVLGMIPSYQWLILVFLMAFSVIVTASQRFNMPRLSPIRRNQYQNDQQVESNLISENLQTFYYKQTLDHFNYQPKSYTTFSQKYFINFKYWGGGGAPILVYLGAEGPLHDDVKSIGFLTDHGSHFKALLVYIEHRFYGESVPLGSQEKAMNDANIRGYFNSAQAIADYAEILLHVKNEFNAQKSPTVVVGGSYGGMLASWFRLKYPHIALGALASSAPILYFDNLTPHDGYHSLVSKDFRETSYKCYKTIKKSWSEIDKEASTKPNGLASLSTKFKTCSPLESSSMLKYYLEMVYMEFAQYSEPNVTAFCVGVDGASSSGRDTLSSIFAGLVAALGNRSCFVNPPSNESQTSIGWSWQSCSDMVMPIGCGNNTMFQPAPFDLSSYNSYCKRFYGVRPRPHWITTYFGGHDIKLILRRFGSNIIFSNGLKDPYSSGGVLEDISNTILAVKTVNGSHCMDIQYERDTDPEWLVAQRKTEVETIQRWIHQYNADLQSDKN